MVLNISTGYLIISRKWQFPRFLTDLKFILAYSLEARIPILVFKLKKALVTVILQKS